VVFVLSIVFGRVGASLNYALVSAAAEVGEGQTARSFSLLPRPSVVCAIMFLLSRLGDLAFVEVFAKGPLSPSSEPAFLFLGRAFTCLCPFGLNAGSSCCLPPWFVKPRFLRSSFGVPL